jgi:hypothetical protein
MIYVFKTSVKSEKDIRQLESYLNQIIPQIKWNFDLEDCDKILRIESKKNISTMVINFLSSKGYHCKELN